MPLLLVLSLQHLGGLAHASYFLRRARAGARVWTAVAERGEWICYQRWGLFFPSHMQVNALEWHINIQQRARTKTNKRQNAKRTLPHRRRKTDGKQEKAMANNRPAPKSEKTQKDMKHDNATRDSQKSHKAKQAKQNRQTANKTQHDRQ